MDKRHRQTQASKDVEPQGVERPRPPRTPKPCSLIERCIGGTGSAPLGVSARHHRSARSCRPPTIWSSHSTTDDHAHHRLRAASASCRPSSASRRIRRRLGRRYPGRHTTGLLRASRFTATSACDQAAPRHRALQPERPTSSATIHVLEDTAMLSEPMRVQYALVRTSHHMFEYCLPRGQLFASPA